MEVEKDEQIRGEVISGADDEADKRANVSGTNETVIERQVQTDLHAAKPTLRDRSSQMGPTKDPSYCDPPKTPVTVSPRPIMWVFE